MKSQMKRYNSFIYLLSISFQNPLFPRNCSWVSRPLCSLLYKLILATRQRLYEQPCYSIFWCVIRHISTAQCGWGYNDFFVMRKNLLIIFCWCNVGYFLSSPSAFLLQLLCVGLQFTSSARLLASAYICC